MASVCQKLISPLSERLMCKLRVYIMLKTEKINLVCKVGRCTKRMIMLAKMQMNNLTIEKCRTLKYVRSEYFSFRDVVFVQQIVARRPANTADPLCVHSNEGFVAFRTDAKKHSFSHFKDTFHTNNFILLLQTIKI